MVQYFHRRKEAASKLRHTAVCCPLSLRHDAQCLACQKGNDTYTADWCLQGRQPITSDRWKEHLSFGWAQPGAAAQNTLCCCCFSWSLNKHL